MKASKRDAILSAWEEYCEVEYDREYREHNSDVCPSCDGYGDHGYEEETGCLYVCYACGGSGKVPF